LDRVELKIEMSSARQKVKQVEGGNMLPKVKGREWLGGPNRDELGQVEG